MNGFSFSAITRPFFWASLIAVTLAGVGANSAQAASSAARSTGGAFYVPINRSELVTTNADISEVIITDPEVANVVVHGKRKVSVMGIGVGQTTMRIFDGDHKLLRSTDVYVTYDLPALRRALKEFLPNEQVGVSTVNTRIALTGEVSSAASAASAVQIAEEFVRNKVKPGEEAKNESSATKASPIINLMKISSGQQVMLRIKIGEVNRTALHRMGINLQNIGRDGLFGLGFSVATGDAGPALSWAADGATAAGEAASAVAAIGAGANPTAEQTAAIAAAGSNAKFNYTRNYKNADMTYTKNVNTFGSFGFNKNSTNQSLSTQIDALEQDGLLKVLAEPSLTALSGEEAQFLAGGEFPIPVAQNLGGVGAANTITVEYKPFGVALKFTPFVLSKNRIRIQVAPEVSDVDPGNSIRSGGFSIPAFVTRRASTTVELAPGESFMIAGLLRDDMNSTISQLPGASEIPILGALFRSAEYQRNETELVIAVTPYLVDPLKDSDIKLPTDDFRPPTFFENMFLGAVVSNRGSKVPTPEGPTGFITDN